jgi:hypothetical protein
MFEPNTQRKANEQATMMRSRLFSEGQVLERAVHSAKKKYDDGQTEELKSRLSFALGKLSGYLTIRQRLSPTIGADVAMNSQSGLLNKLCKEFDIPNITFR